MQFSLKLIKTIEEILHICTRKKEKHFEVKGEGCDCGKMVKSTYLFRLFDYPTNINPAKFENLKHKTRPTLQHLRYSKICNNIFQSFLVTRKNCIPHKNPY